MYTAARPCLTQVRKDAREGRTRKKCWLILAGQPGAWRRREASSSSNTLGILKHVNVLLTKTLIKKNRALDGRWLS